jgi:hypothetical protein
VALTSGPGRQARMREAISRGPGRAVKIGRREIIPGKQTATGGTAPFRGGEVTRVEADAS